MKAALPGSRRELVIGAVIGAVLGACLWNPALVQPARAAGDLSRKFARRSVSSSRQFIVYCPDARLRLAVTGYVETAKAAVLRTLGIGDHWKLPIVVNMEAPSTTRPGQALTRVELIDTEEGAMVQVAVTMREEQFKEIHFPQQVVTAVLLEIAYRERPPAGGESFVPPPAWLVEGIADRLQARAGGAEPNAALFKTLIDTGRIPKIRDFLESRVETMDPTSREVFGMCSASLIEMLTDLPEGRANLAAAVKKLRDSGGDSVNLLLKHFPSLGKSETSLEKWWTVALARFSASDRYRALTVADTNARLEPLLRLEIVTDEKKGTKETFTLEEFRKFVKLRTAKPALLRQAATLAALQPKAHPLLRPVLAEYQRIATSLSERKTRKIEESLASVANYRAMVVERSDKIADYMNWFEATQVSERSGAFDSYLKTAKAIENTPQPRRDDPISRYIDQVEREFE